MSDFIVFMQYDESGAAIGLVSVREDEVELSTDDEGYQVNATDLPNGTKAGRALVFGTVRSESGQ